jgi:hypothetical protein
MRDRIDILSSRQPHTQQTPPKSHRARSPALTKYIPCLLANCAKTSCQGVVLQRYEPDKGQDPRRKGKMTWPPIRSSDMPYHTNQATLRQFQEHRPSPDDGMAWHGMGMICVFWTLISVNHLIKIATLSRTW